MSKFSEHDFEQKLFKLKDSHDSIATLSNWCLSHVEHHGKIVATWLGALKKVKNDHRVLLFYLANDIIQYSKKKGLPYVGTFGPALQKATTMVRDANIRNKILRIFKIWDERNIYDESFLVDLSSLLTRGHKSANRIDIEDFQPTLLYSRLKSCQTLEEDTDAKMKQLVENTMPLTDTDRLRTTLKNRKASEDVISEIDEGISKITDFIGALEAEIKERSGLIDLLDISEQFYEKELTSAKTVSNAYKCFTNRVKSVKKKLDEKIEILPSPVPTPSPTAPSPEPEDTPERTFEFTPGGGTSFLDGSLFSNSSVAEEFDNFYGRGVKRQAEFGFNGDTPVPVPPVTVPAPSITVPPINVPPVFNYFRPITDTVPPPPPPPPPPVELNATYNSSFHDTTDLSNCSSEGLKIEVITTPTKEGNLSNLLETLVTDNVLPPPPAPPLEFGWNDNPDYWESPESPPLYEKEGLPAPLVDVGLTIGSDVDMRSKDVDHRNLISLTGGVEDWDFPHGIGDVGVNEDMELSDDDGGKIEDVKVEGFPIKKVPDIKEIPLIPLVDGLEGKGEVFQHMTGVSSPSNKRNVTPFLPPPPPPPPSALMPEMNDDRKVFAFPPPPAPPFDPGRPPFPGTERLPPPPPPPFAADSQFPLGRFPPLPRPPLPPQSPDSPAGQPIPSFDASASGRGPNQFPDRPPFFPGFRPRFEPRNYSGGPPMFRGGSPHRFFRPQRPRFPPQRF